jgi:putative Mg2+ transporter-C (MgtC) family protein
VIFVRRDAVRGLTTAATIWLTAAVGMAAGAGLWLLAIPVTAGHFLVVLAFTPLDGRGVLRLALAECTRRDFSVGELSIEQRGEEDEPRTVSVWLSVQGSRSISELTAALADIGGVLAVSSDDANAPPP